MSYIVIVAPALFGTLCPEETFSTWQNGEFSRVPWNQREAIKRTVCDTACTYTAKCQLSTLPNFGIDDRKIEKNEKTF
jgi:hypothetical protein